MRIIAFIFCMLITLSLCYIHTCRLQGAKYRKLAIIVDGRQRADLVLAASLKGLKTNPFNINLHGYAAHALMNMKEYKPALMHLNIMLKYYPYNLNALFNTMYANFYTGNIENAFKLLDRIQRIQPKYVLGEKT